LCLNGKTIVIGYQEDFEIEGLKMKRTLMPSGGKTVMEMLTANLGPEEIKAMVMKQIEKADEATKKEAEAQIDQAIAGGQLYIKAGGKGTYVYGDDGWPTSISQDIDLDQAGQKMTEKEVTTLKQ
jgi:glutamate synthase domain-containing protein 1